MDEQTQGDGEKFEINSTKEPETQNTKPKSIENIKRTKKVSNKSRKTDKGTKKGDKPDDKKFEPIPITEEQFNKRSFYLKKCIAYNPNEQLKNNYIKQLEKLKKRPIIS